MAITPFSLSPTSEKPRAPRQQAAEKRSPSFLRFEKSRALALYRSAQGALEFVGDGAYYPPLTVPRFGFKGHLLRTQVVSPVFRFGL